MTKKSRFGELSQWRVKSVLIFFAALRAEKKTKNGNFPLNVTIIPAVSQPLLLNQSVDNSKFIFAVITVPTVEKMWVSRSKSADFLANFPLVSANLLD